MRKRVETMRTRRLCAAMIVATCAAAFAADAPTTEPNVVTITGTILEVTGRALECYYHITNRSSHDLWLCESMSQGKSNFEALVCEDGKTLLVRRRLGFFSDLFVQPPTGQHVRLPAGTSRTELLSLSLPVRVRRILTGGGRRGQSLCTKLCIEIGYYDKGLPSMNLPLPYANMISETLDRKEQVVIPHRFDMGEQTLTFVVENVRIPCLSEYGEVTPTDTVFGTRVAIEFKPSALPFLFPFVDEQALLSEDEQQRMRSLTRATIDDTSSLRAIAEDLRTGHDGAFLCVDATAVVTSYRDGARIASFVIDRDGSVLSEGGQVFRYPGRLPSLRAALPGVQPLDLRIRCARNLQDLWCRLSSKTMPHEFSACVASGEGAIAYPPPDEWCDTAVLPYQTWDRTGTGASVRPLRCPAADEGKCHYAMNPICEPNSPGDMVLLFETKAGWNQHGGAELFTFDNHNPKGGCVLLNDGSVRFIRTEQELHALRWR